MKRNISFTSGFGRTEESHNQDYENLMKRLEIEGKEKEELAKQAKTKAKTPKQPKQAKTTIVLANLDMQFITDKNLYDEIKKYFTATFKGHEDIFNKLVWNDKDSVAKGSNSYIATGVDMFCKTQLQDYRIARQADLETNLQMFKDFYIDSGLALRSLKDPNKDKARHLYNQLKSVDFPVWIDLKGLTLDSNLNFNLTDESIYKKAECLNWENGTKYSKTDDYGLPKEKDESSTRQIWTTNKGLARCFLDRGSNLYSGFEGLDGSGDDGRVVLVKA